MMWFMCVLMEQKCIFDVAKLKPPPSGNKLLVILFHMKEAWKLISFIFSFSLVFSSLFHTPHITVLRFTVGYVLYSEAAN